MIMENRYFRRMKMQLKENEFDITLASLDVGLSFSLWIISIVLFCKGYTEQSAPLYGFVSALVLLCLFSVCIGYEVMRLIKLIKKRKEIKYKLYLMEMEVMNAHTLDEDE